MSEAPPVDVSVGRRGLDGLAAIQDVGALRRVGHYWCLPFTISIEASAGPIPPRTQWFLVVDPTYPLGMVKVMPAKVGGIEFTFPHQSRNDLGPPDLPWRTGKLCLGRSLATLGITDESPTAPGRMAWHATRAVEWMQAAVNDRLRGPGERFELPEMPPQGDLLGFIEDSATFDAWLQDTRVRGFADVVKIDNWWRVQSFGSRPLPWGTWGASAAGTAKAGFIRLPAVPVVRDWSFPLTWGELRAACTAIGVSLDDHLKCMLPKLRLERSPVVLVGAPIPATWDGVPAELHWWAIRFPRLATGTKQPKGFRATEKSRWLADRNGPLADARLIEWMSTTNHAPARRRARGSHQAVLASKSVLVIGVGALGSQVAELLVRLGAQNVVLVDSDDFEIGNLARHALTLTDVGRPKAVALAERLCRVSGTAVIKGVKCSAASIPQIDNTFDAIIDCTADADTLDALRLLADGERIIDWASASLSVDAGRLYLFHARAPRFPRERFEREMHPWVERDWNSIDPSSLETEGIGCWHPLSPARADDVAAAAAISVRAIEERLSGDAGDARLSVYERRHDVSGFAGFIRV